MFFWRNVSFRTLDMAKPRGGGFLSVEEVQHMFRQRILFVKKLSITITMVVVLMSLDSLCSNAQATSPSLRIEVLSDSPEVDLGLYLLSMQKNITRNWVIPDEARPPEAKKGIVTIRLGIKKKGIENSASAEDQKVSHLSHISLRLVPAMKCSTRPHGMPSRQ